MFEVGQVVRVNYQKAWRNKQLRWSTYDDRRLIEDGELGVVSGIPPQNATKHLFSVTWLAGGTSWHGSTDGMVAVDAT